MASTFSFLGKGPTGCSPHLVRVEVARLDARKCQKTQVRRLAYFVFSSRIQPIMKPPRETSETCLAPDDYEALLAWTLDVHRADSVSALLAHALPALSRLIEYDLLVFQYFLTGSQQPVLQFAHPDFPFTEEEVRYYVEHATEFPAHDFVAKNPGISTFRLSDCLPLQEWLEHHMYQHCKARLGYRYTLMAYEGRWRVDNAISLDRKDRDFTGTEKKTLDHAAGHLFLRVDRLLNLKGQRPWREPLLHDWVATELGLTNREAEVLLQLRKGTRNAEIARLLGVSPATVKKHLENTYAKLGIKSRFEAIQRINQLLGG